MKYLNEINVSNKRVFIRADLNVPLTDELKVGDDTRIRAALDTILFVVNNGGSAIVSSHLGDPGGKRDASFSLKPVADYMSNLLKREVLFANDCVGPEVSKLAKALKPKEVLLLENLRFHPGEKANDEGFARELASLADIYINDAFATAHRAHASTVGMVKYSKLYAAGLTIKRELEYFNKAFEAPVHPFMAILGGAKVSTKIEVIRNLAKKADKILIGGAMANTFLAARGLQVGKSLFEPEQIETAQQVEGTLAETNKLLLPIDVIVASDISEPSSSKVVGIDAVPPHMTILDIGPKTIAMFKNELDIAKTIIWNGPMGAFEHKGFERGTYGIVDLLVNCKNALRVVGGGDTDRAIHEQHALEKLDFVSTAGGAFLKLLEGKKLPAIEALKAPGGAGGCC